MTTILVALDDSPRAPHVLAKASDLALKLGATLVMFRAVGIPKEMPVEAYLMSPEDVTRLLEGRARASLVEMQASVPRGVSSEVQVDVGRAWQAICAAATSMNVDLIVIGSHGYSGLDHVLGTTAAKVVDHADRSVLVVR